MEHRISKLKDSSPITFWISNPLRARLSDHAFKMSDVDKRRVTIREIIEQALVEHLDKHSVQA